MPQQKPWELYQQTDGPWTQYQQSSQPASTPQAVTPHDDRTPAQVAIDQAKQVAQGGMDTFRAHGQAPSDLPATFEEARRNIDNYPQGRGQALVDAIRNPKSYQGAIPTVVRGANTAFVNPEATAPTREEWEQAARESGNLLTGSLTSAYGPKLLNKAATNIREYTPNRMMSSLMKPREGNFDFGVDPVKAMNEAGVAGATMKKVVERANQSLDQTEIKLQGITKKYEGMYDDVAPAMRAAAEAEAKAAMLDGKKGTARSIRQMAESRIQAINDKYGSTRLNPEQIRIEKTALGKSTNFTPEAKQVSLNQAKMRIYGALDQKMDFMTGNESAPVNKQYAGLLEGTQRLTARQQEMLNAPVVPQTAFGTLTNALGKVLTEAGLKTGLAQLTRDRFAMPEVNPQTHSPLSQAFRPPVVESPGSYPTQGLGDVVEGGTYRVTEPGTGTHPANLSNAVEGGQYRVSEPATGTHPTQLSIIKDGGTYRIVETATGTHPTSLVNATEGGQYKISEPATGTHPSQLTSAKEGGTYRVAEPATGTYPTQAYGEAREAPVMTGKSTIRPVLQYGTDPQTGARIPIAVIDAATGRIIRKLQ